MTDKPDPPPDEPDEYPSAEELQDDPVTADDIDPFAVEDDDCEDIDDFAVETWIRHTTPSDRDRAVATALPHPRSASVIAANAHVEETTARSHLDRLANEGVLRTIETETDRGDVTEYWPDPSHTRAQTRRDLLEQTTTR